MTSITISIPEERWQQLQEVADRYQLTTEELVLISVEDLLKRPEEDFQLPEL